MIVAVLYLSMKLIKVTAIELIVINVMHCIILEISEKISADQRLELSIGVGLVIVVCYVCYKITHLLAEFQEENMTTITNKAREQEETANKITQIAEEIIKNFDKSKDVSDELKNIVEVSHASISNIADSIEDTAETIEKQRNMTFDIKNNIENTEKEAVKMVNISENTYSLIKES